MMKKIIEPFKSLGLAITRSSDTVLYGAIAILVILGPIFFVPVYGMSIAASKGFFVVLLTLLALIIGGIAVLKQGSLSIPKHPLFIVLIVVSLTLVVGVLFGSSHSMAFWGYGFETTTWLFVTVLGILTVIAYHVVTNYERVGILYGGLFLVGLITAMVHLIRFFAGPGFLNLGVLGSSVASLVGSWTDLGIFMGIILLISVVTLQLAGLTRFAKWTVMVIAAVAGMFLLFMNTGIVWIVMGLISLLLVLYLFAFAYWDTRSKSYKKEQRVPWYVLGLFVVSLVGIFFGGLLNTWASRYQSIAWNEARPSLSATVQVAQKSLVHNPVTGYGPNTFALGWNVSKDVKLSGTEIGGNDFQIGYSYLATLIASNGILALLVWIAFLAILGYVILKRLGQGFENALDRYFVISLGAVIVFLGCIMIVATPGAYVLAVFFVMVGIFLGLFVPKKESVFSFIKDPRASFFGILGITVFLAATLITGYVVTRKLMSWVYDTQGMVLISQNNVQGAFAKISKATAYAGHDHYHIQLAELALGTISTLKDPKQAEQTLGLALAHAKMATEKNPDNYRNWVMVGNVYQAAVTLGVADAAQLADDAYRKAQSYNPMDATMYLHLAELALASKDITGAFKSIQDSIDQYPTADAYAFQGRIYMNQKRWNEAVIALKQAVGKDPSRPANVLLLAVAYERSGDSQNANVLYEAIRRRFTDAEQVITNARNSFSQIPEDLVPKPVVAPKEKK